MEYETYRERVRSQLTRRGWAEVDPSAAEVIVVFDYLIDEGKPYIIDVPLLGETGVSGSSTKGHVGPFGTFSGTTTYTPRFGIVGYRTRSYEVYSRRAYLMVLDTMREVDGRPMPLFQGTAVSDGTTPHLSPVMPFLVDAIFSEFTGPSGSITEYHSAY